MTTTAKSCLMAFDDVEELVARYMPVGEGP
jgi:hypothetical protein